MKLVEVNYIGELRKKNFFYEIVFCDDKIKAKVRGIKYYKWGNTPAKLIPERITLDDTLNLETLYFTVPEKLVLLKESGSYSLNDAFDDIIPLAWSNNIYIDKRIKLKYGEEIKNIKDEFFSLNIDIKKII